MTDPTSAPAPAELAPADADEASDERVHDEFWSEAGAAERPPLWRRAALGARAAGVRFVQMPIEGWLSLFVVAACAVFVAYQVGFVVRFSAAFPFIDLSENLILRDTTPAGGDMGAHVWGPAYLRDELLPRGRLTGWSPDWYAGLPAYHFYMVPPALAIALLSYVIPYGIAFKLVAISGVVTMPISAWAFGRLSRLPFPTPPLLALATTLFLFDHSFNIFGGNLASTLAGEFAFSMSLSIALVYLGVVGRGLETGRHRVAAAVLLALCGLTHIIPAFFALAGTAAWFVLRPGWRRLQYLAYVLPVGGLLSAWWVLPFVWRRGYMNDMGWEKKENYCTLLWDRGAQGEAGSCTAPLIPDALFDYPPLHWVLALAAVGVLLSLVNRRRAGLTLVVTVLLAALAVRYTPEGRLWNARITPFYYLGLYMLAAIGVGEFARTVAALVAPNIDRPLRAVRWAVLGLAAVVTYAALAIPLRAMPFGETADDGTYRWGWITSDTQFFVNGWAGWNFRGYEDARPQSPKAWPEYHAIVTTMDQLGEERGCGRAMWEHEGQHDRYGTPMALMLLPFWTSGCIGSMEGLYFETSATTPYHFLNQDQLSSSPSNAQRNLPYSPGAPSSAEFDLGVAHLQMFGVRYYMAISELMHRHADEHPSLTLVATSGPWNVYEVADTVLVEPLLNEPAVVRGAGAAGDVWLELAVDWYQDRDRWEVFLAAGGPPTWQQIDPGEEPAIVPQPSVVVSDIELDEDRVSFRVDRTGVPVLVKVSYFPNWTVNGAQGPWRVTPNLMVVVPTANEVELVYGFTPIDYLAWVLTFVGLAGVVVLWRMGPIPMPSPARFWAVAERPQVVPAVAAEPNETPDTAAQQTTVPTEPHEHGEASPQGPT